MDAHELYSALVRSSDDGIVAKDLDGNILSWNPAAEALFGYSAEEMVGGSIRRLLPPDRQSEEDDILARIRAGEKVGQFYTKRLHKSGRLIDVAVAVSPMRNARGEIVGASKNVRDASEYVAARRKLEESETRFRLMADNIAQLAWVLRPDGTYEWVNKRFSEFSGLTLDDMTDGARGQLLHPDHVERVYEKFRHAIEAGEEWEDLFPLRGADGNYRWFLSRALPIRDAEGNITQWFGTNTDITEQREQAEQIRLLLHEVNHRSKNMLATVQALARKTAPDDAGFIEQFERRVAGLAVNQDILVRREWREVPLDELVKLQLRFLGQAEEHLRIHGPECPLTPRAAEVIGMALHELATNSLKYGALSVEGASVEVGWEITRDDRLCVWWRESGGPRVEPPTRTGFGTMLIRDVPAQALSAEISLDYAPDGLRWQLQADTAKVTVRPDVRAA